MLHDGPPFANGDIHIGHLINKTLKDIILRFRTMQGYQTPYVPGWDCHGLPIEHQIQEQVKKEGKNYRDLDKVDVRQRCFAHATKFAASQSEQFQRLGILGDWANPYLTMAPAYEASTLEVFAKFVEAGLVYKQLKPVPWSVANQTALADAELEYEDVTDPSVYVEFPLVQERMKDEGERMNEGEESSASSFSLVPSSFPTHLLVWTTTPWTLPANLAVAIAPKGEYAFVRYTRDGVTKVGVIGAALVDLVFKGRESVASYEVVATKLGEELLHLEYRHPFIERTGKVLPADYVTVAATEGEEPGTGLVHTAPGHGADDYETGVKFGLDIYSPVLASGRFDDTTPEFVRGKTTKEGNVLITAKLKELGLLLAEVPIKHSYPHDWRSKTPIIFRATEQWFVAMDKAYTPHGALVGPAVPADGPRAGAASSPASPTAGTAGPTKAAAPATVRDRALAAAHDQVSFIPEWGRHRLDGMLKSRPDWCVSRQRAWGLPIPVFYNEQGEALLTPDSVRAVAKRLRREGSGRLVHRLAGRTAGRLRPGSELPERQAP